MGAEVTRAGEARTRCKSGCTGRGASRRVGTFPPACTRLRLCRRTVAVVATRQEVVAAAAKANVVQMAKVAAAAAAAGAAANVATEAVVRPWACW